MKNLYRVLKWLALGLGLLLLLVVVGVAIYTRTETFTRWAREEAIGVINGLIRGSVSAERLEGSVWRHLTLYNVALRYEDSEILKIPRLEVSFSLLPLLWGELKIAAIDAVEPTATLLQDSEGRWNVIEALSPRYPEPEKKSEFVVLVQRFRLHDGAIDLRPAANNSKPYYLKDLSLQGRIGIRPAGVSLEAGEVNAQLTTAGQPELRLKGGFEYKQQPSPPSTLTIKDLWAVSRNSRLKLNGQVAHGETVKIKAEAVLDKLAPFDIAYFVAEWPLKRDLAGNIAVDGTLDALNGTVQIAGAGAKIDGKFRADLAGKIPQYSATAAVSGFDFRQWLKDERLAGVVSGTFEGAGNGFALQGTTASARLQVQSAEAQGWKLGDVSLEGRLQKSIAMIDGQLKSKMGSANWSGQVMLAEKQPSYEGRFAVTEFDIQKLGQNGKAIDGKLNLRGSIKGSGFNLADMNTRADVQVLPSSLASTAITQGVFDVSLSENKLHIARAVLNTSESMLSANGEFGLDAKMSGKLDYRLRIGDVAPWLSLVSHKGSGAVQLTGNMQGNLTDLQARGTARLSGLHVDSMGARDGSIEFALRGSKDQIFPQGTIIARIADVDAGILLRRVDASAKLSRQPQSIALDLTAQDAHDRKHSLSGTADFLPDSVVVHLSQASLAAPDGLWKLLHPATVTKRDEVLLIDQFALKNGERELSINGRFAFDGKQDLTLNIDRLPVETLTGLLPQPPKMSGLLAMRAQVSGTAAAPEITASARLTSATIAEQAYAGADADLAYKDKRASLRFVVRQDAAHSLDGSGAVPLNLSWQNGWRADFADGLELRAQSSGLSVAFLNAFAGKAVGDIAGEASLDLSARGSLKAPDVRGTFRLRDGKLKLIPLGVDINQVAIAGNLDARTVMIRELSAKAKDGEIRGSGAFPLKDYESGSIKLSLSAKDWPAIQTTRYQAKVGGNIELQGALTAPRITGEISVIEASLRPDLAFLEQTKVPLKRDETIIVVNNAATRNEAQVQTQNGASSAESQLFKKLSLDVMLRAPGNLWVRHPELVSELSGNLRATKKPDADVELTGRIDVVRGALSFQGRRFQLSRGSIQFTGGDKINPALNVVAEYKLPEYEVDAVLGGTAQKPSLTLTSQPRLEQADILALLLFGRPVNALNQNERGSVQQSALNITSGYVAGKIANSVSQALGLDTLGLDLREVDFSGGQVGFGRYVGGKTYLSFSQQLSGEHGGEVSLEYQIAPDWKIGTSANSTGANGIDIIWHKRY